MLLSLLAFSLVLIAVLESLSRMNKASGGITFLEREDTPFISFSYFYLPTILAVCYSMLWA